MNIFADIRTLVIETLDAMVADGEIPSGLDYGHVTVEPPRDAAHGDMATNAAMVLAKRAGAQPRAIAEALAPRLKADPRVAVVDVAGPGFINLILDGKVWQDVVTEAIDAGPAFGHSGMGAHVKVNVEYVSANPTGPLHVGHTGARSSGMRWRASLRLRVTRSRENTTSTTAVRRWMSSRGRPSNGTVRLTA